MQELIDRIVAASGLSPDKAEKGLGIMLNLIKTQGNQNKVQELFDKLPGAEALARGQGGDGAGYGGGGLLGMLAGGMMGGPRPPSRSFPQQAFPWTRSRPWAPPRWTMPRRRRAHSW